VINNVETLANVAIIIAWRRGLPQGRHAKSPGTQLVSISGHIAAPGRLRGRVRLPAGEVHLRGLRRHAGRQGKLKCIIPGGISTKVLTPPRSRAVTYDHEAMEAPARRSAPAA
jgi:NADH-quinone oxidoreductase subunit F